MFQKVEGFPRLHNYLVTQQGSNSGLTHKLLPPFTATHLAKDSLFTESGRTLEQTPNNESTKTALGEEVGRGIVKSPWN